MKSAPMVEFIRRATALAERPPAQPQLLEEMRAGLARLIATPDWLPAAFATPRPEHYQQYLLHCDPLERFSVVSFVWGPGQQTPVHDHLTWGVVGQLRGREVSTNFRRRPDQSLYVWSVDALDPGETIAFTPEQGDIHQVVNDTDELAISIHVYGANIGTVQRHVYDPMTGETQPFVSGYSAAVPANFWG